MAHLCVCVYCSLSLYLGWASDALAAASGTHFKLAHATDADDEVVWTPERRNRWRALLNGLCVHMSVPMWCTGRGTGANATVERLQPELRAMPKFHDARKDFLSPATEEKTYNVLRGRKDLHSSTMCVFLQGALDL